MERRLETEKWHFFDLPNGTAAPIGPLMTTTTRAEPSRRKSRHRIHANPFNVPEPEARPDWAAIFERSAPIALEIGYGQGAFLQNLARKHPEWNVIGLEIRPHFVERAISEAKEAGLSNLYAVLANANRDLDTLIPDQSVAFVSVNFPDPWFKKRHHKRRVIQDTMLDLLGKKFMADGEFHLMTDFEPIGLDALELFTSRADYQNVLGEDRFSEATTTAITSEREITHEGRGDPIYRLAYRHCGV